MRPYSTELRKTVLAAYEAGEGSMGLIASRYGVSRSFVCDVIRLARETGSVEPRPHAGGRPRVLSSEHEEVVLRIHSDDPKIRVVDLCERFGKVTGVAVSHPTMWRVLDRLGISRRKRSQSNAEWGNDQDGPSLSNVG